MRISKSPGNSGGTSGSRRVRKDRYQTTSAIEFVGHAPVQIPSDHPWRIEPHWTRHQQSAFQKLDRRVFARRGRSGRDRRAIPSPSQRRAPRSADARKLLHGGVIAHGPGLLPGPESREGSRSDRSARTPSCDRRGHRIKKSPSDEIRRALNESVSSLTRRV
jgi:hypothetical protein